MDAVEAERGLPCLVIDPEERGEGCCVASTSNSEHVTPAADDLVQVVAVGVVPGMHAVRRVAWIGVCVFAFGGVDAQIDHPVAPEKEQPNMKAQLDGNGESDGRDHKPGSIGTWEPGMPQGSSAMYLHIQPSDPSWGGRLIKHKAE